MLCRQAGSTSIHMIRTTCPAVSGRSWTSRLNLPFFFSVHLLPHLFLGLRALVLLSLRRRSGCTHCRHYLLPRSWSSTDCLFRSMHSGNSKSSYNYNRLLPFVLGSAIGAVRVLACLRGLPGSSTHRNGRVPLIIFCLYSLAASCSAAVSHGRSRDRRLYGSSEWRPWRGDSTCRYSRRSGRDFADGRKKSSGRCFSRRPLPHTSWLLSGSVDRAISLLTFFGILLLDYQDWQSEVGSAGGSTVASTKQLKVVLVLLLVSGAALALPTR